MARRLGDYMDFCRAVRKRMSLGQTDGSGVIEFTDRGFDGIG